MSSNNLNVVNLDFDANKASLRDFLRTQQQFVDYNFEGSGMSVLLDVLSYNTHYLAFYLSMLGSEMFLDSSVLRSSAVSHAKQLGYTPRSIRAARAVVQIVIVPNDGATNMVIQKGTRFNARVNNTSYTFITEETYSASLGSGRFLFPAVTLVEGTPYTYRINVNRSIPNQKYLLPNAAVDTTTLTVQVQKSITDPTVTLFAPLSNFLQITADTAAYFLQETETGSFEVYFGDGIVGKSVQDGNVVVLNYTITHGVDGNGASTFTPAEPLGPYPAYLTTVKTVVPANGGTDPESIDSIRYNAPKNFESQGRAVTVTDYTLLIQNQYNNADSVVVWGGETENPPQYGKVFISIKPLDGFVITEAEKQLVLSTLVNQRNLVSIIPQFVDPDYTFIEVDTVVKYSTNNTSKTLGEIQVQAKQAIINFANTELNKFFLGFKYSRLLTTIDNCDISVSNNLTSIRMKKIFSPTLNAIQNYVFNMNAGIMPGTLVSSTFVTTTDKLLIVPYTPGKTYKIVDDGNGFLLMIQSGLGIPDRVVRACGTIDYNTGVVKIDQIIPNMVDVNGDMSISMTPSNNDIEPIRNNILFIDPNDIILNVIPVA